MLVERLEDPEGTSPEHLYRRYLREMARIVDDIGPENAAEATGIDRSRLDALEDGDPELSLPEAAEILALTSDWPDAETVVRDVRDHLRLLMSAAIVDVDYLEMHLDFDLQAKEIQQKIEGRLEMSLEEYAHILSQVERRDPYR